MNNVSVSGSELTQNRTNTEVQVAKLDCKFVDVVRAKLNFPGLKLATELHGSKHANSGCVLTR